MNIILFEDSLVTELFPITAGRTAHAIGCGGYRLAHWANSLGHPVRSIVRPHLREVERASWPEFFQPMPTTGPTILINSRIAPSREVGRILEELANSPDPGVVFSGDEDQSAPILAVLPENVPPPAENLDTTGLDDYLDTIDFGALPPLDISVPIFRYPHDVVRYHMTLLNDNLEHRLKHGDYHEIEEGVFAAEGARPSTHLVTNTTEGPIIIDRNAIVGPYCYLSGPVYIGQGSRIIEHSALKDGVMLGHTTKIGGEVEASVIEPYTNKQHHGFLGHSYLGSWINLGAGTCNSDLKNTYGEVSMIYNGQKVPTGMQFLGSIIGDYTKTAINTSIFTGKLIGACSMCYGFITRNVPSFCNFARTFSQITIIPADVMITTQARMFARRNVEQRPCDMQLLRDMYELTRHERQWTDEQLLL